MRCTSTSIVASPDPLSIVSFLQEQQQQLITSCSSKKDMIVPILVDLDADLLTPVSAYLKMTNGANNPYSFLFESVTGGEAISRFSYIGASKDEEEEGDG